MLPYHVVDAFTDPYSTRAATTGNPAGVVVTASELPDDQAQRIAAENNLSETAFVVPRGGGRFGLSWFTPVREVDLCGHATLATAHVLFAHQNLTTTSARFQTRRSGELTVRRVHHFANTPDAAPAYAMDFPARPIEPADDDLADRVRAALGLPTRDRPAPVHRNEDLFVVLDTPEAVRQLQPDLPAVASLPARGVIVTAASPHEPQHFVSRFFAPAYGVPEDPVTGSAHCTLAPYWSRKLGRQELTAHQASPRGGTVHCKVHAERVTLTGHAVTYLSGHLHV